MSSFELIRSQRIESLNIEAQEYRHGITGARHLHLSANDNNNAFIVGFRTLPGIPPAWLTSSSTPRSAAAGASRYGTHFS